MSYGNWCRRSASSRFASTRRRKSGCGKGLRVEEGKVTEEAAAFPVDGLCSEGCGLVVEVRLIEGPGFDASFEAAAFDNTESQAVGDRQQDKGGVDQVGRNQVTGGCDTGVDGLNGLMGEGKVTADDNVDVVTWFVQLHHGRSS